MAHTNQLGLDTDKSKQLADKLNLLLANLQVFYLNVRGFHWNITGKRFFELHAKFEELYTDLLEKVDEVAERVLTIGYTPTHAFSDYLQISTIKEATNITGGKEAVEKIVQGFQSLLEVERDLLHLSSEAEDEGTSALLSDYIRQHEKQIWMYSASLK